MVHVLFCRTLPVLEAASEKTKSVPHSCAFSDTKEYQELFEFVRSEILLNDCLESVEESGLHPTLKVLSFNAMVQQGVKDEKEWVLALAPSIPFVAAFQSTSGYCLKNTG